MIRRIVILPPNTTPGMLEVFMAKWKEEDGKPEKLDAFTNMEVKIIQVNPPSAHEVWLHHQVSWRVR